MLNDEDEEIWCSWYENGNRL